MAASVDADRQREIEYLKEKLIAGGVDYDAFKEKLVANAKRTLDMFQEDHDKEPNPCLEATRIKMAAKIAGSYATVKDIKAPARRKAAGGGGASDRGGSDSAEKSGAGGEGGEGGYGDGAMVLHDVDPEPAHAVVWAEKLAAMADL